jgi:AmmeMemoRadiSam system protein B
VPLVVGETNPDLVAEVLACLWGGNETLIIVSSDLSHYHSYQDALKLDADTAGLIENLDPVVKGEQACGCHAINGLLLAAQQNNLLAERLFLNNSGDTAGTKDKVVGYGAFTFHQA